MQEISELENMKRKWNCRSNILEVKEKKSPPTFRPKCSSAHFWRKVTLVK